MIEKKRGKN